MMKNGGLNESLEAYDKTLSETGYKKSDKKGFKNKDFAKLYEFIVDIVGSVGCARRQFMMPP